MKRPQEPRYRGEGAPTRFAEGNPSTGEGLDHSFTLQAVMEMKESLGVFGERIERLREDVRDLSKKVEDNSGKVDKINTTLARWTTGAAVAVAIVLILWSIAQLVPWDRISIRPAEQDAPAANPAQAPTR